MKHSSYHNVIEWRNRRKALKELRDVDDYNTEHWLAPQRALYFGRWHNIRELMVDYESKNLECVLRGE